MSSSKLDSSDAFGSSINEAEAATVRRIFNEYAAGKSSKAIAKQLNRDSIRGPSGTQPARPSSWTRGFWRRAAPKWAAPKFSNW